MPANTVATHPKGLQITFTEADHLYLDENQIDYVSATTLIRNAFEKFDAPRIANRKSAKTGVPVEQYIAEWKANGERAARQGTRMHENCEMQILNRISEMHQPTDEEERNRFRAAWFEVEKIKGAFQSLHPELIVFSPRFRVAGSIDLLAKRAEGEYCIIDWKAIKELKTEAFGGRTGNHVATAHLPDCNYYHYSLQLSIYENILKLEGYIPLTAKVDRLLNVYTDAAFDSVHCQDLTKEALILMAWNVTDAGLTNIPF